MRYDIMGRPVESSNPAEISGGFVPYGDDYTAGWQYTEQTYDWEGRPLVTTHPDSTTRTASYSGCGCAGGETVTLQDEGTMISSTLTRRKQTVTKDVLGRTIKAVTYNWDGTSIYSSSTSDYNALDQVISTKQYQGDAGGSSPYQESTFAYDGYGRLHTRHEPIFASSTYTTYTYNADDTIATTTDPRGAVATFTYNNRRMVTDIEYSAPSGITVPDPVEYEFDGAGNRTSMTDGSGNVEYAYNQLSQLTSETREFDGLSGSFTLEYTYSLTGALASVEDAFGAEVDYAHDSVGRVTDITGSGFGGVTTYASNREFRAWGAVKSMDYGNSLSMTADYNNRMKMTDFNVPGIMGAEMDYQPDGHPDYVHDTVDNKFDRAYTFDQAARLSMALTGSEARGGTTADGPYHQTFAYDVWGNMVDHDTRHWTETYPMTATSYTNDRHAGWTYDAAGNATEQADDTIYTFDAAGRLVSAYNPLYSEFCGTTGGPNTVESTNVNTYDGDGETTKKAQTRAINGGPSGFTVTKYFLRSTALGGEMINLITGGGLKQQGFVFADGGILAKQLKNGSNEKVLWEHTNPATGVIWRTDDTGTLLGREELDPLGANVGSTNPYSTSGGGSTGVDCEGSQFHTPRPAANDVDGSCYIDGVEAPCGMAMNLANHGGGTKITDLNKKDELGRPRQEPTKKPEDDLRDIFDKLNGFLRNPKELELSRRLSNDSSTSGPMSKQEEEAAAKQGALAVVTVPLPEEATLEVSVSDLPNLSSEELSHGRVRCPPTSERLLKNGTVWATLVEADRQANEFLKTNGRWIEFGGWIYENLRTGEIKTSIKPPDTSPPLPKNYPYLDAGDRVYLNNPPTMDGFRIVGEFHLHLGNVRPNANDDAVADRHGVPGILGTTSQLWPYGTLKRGIWGKGTPPGCE